MFYSQEAIDVLVNRIGWNRPVPPYAQFIITDENLRADSRKTFSQYSKFATTENVADVIPNPYADDTAINAYLYNLKVEAATNAMAAMFDNNEAANYRTNAVTGQVEDISTKDYSSIIIANPQRFDTVVGLSGAIATVQLIQATPRSNFTERMAKEGLKVNLDGVLNGFFTEFGKPIGKGLFFEREAAIRSLSNGLFIDNTSVVPNARPVLRDKSNMW